MSRLSKLHKSFEFIQKKAFENSKEKVTAVVVFEQPLPSGEIIDWIEHCPCKVQSLCLRMYYTSNNGCNRGFNESELNEIEFNELAYQDISAKNLIAELESKHLSSVSEAENKTRDIMASLRKGKEQENNLSQSVTGSFKYASYEQQRSSEVNRDKFNRVWFVYKRVNIIGLYEELLQLFSDPRVCLIMTNDS